jgi:FKBP-type peptidyl-prolyl cis-trans isomerase FkpA
MKENVLKQALAIVLAAALVVGCATAEEHKAAEAGKAAAPAKCEPPPKELVTKDLVVGTGRTVENRTPVLVNYTGWLYDGCAKDLKGKEFDSSAGRVTPFGFIAGIGNVIKGWQQGVIGMKEKGKRLLVIPPDMAYGAREIAGKIPPNSTLVFEVEVITIVGGPPSPSQKTTPQ